MNVFAFAAVVTVLFGQVTPQSFVGTWAAEFKGVTYARLELQNESGSISGRVSLGGIHVTNDGTVDEVSFPATNWTPVFDVRLSNGVLTFARKDGDDIDRFELRLLGSDAELTLVFTADDRERLAQEDVPLPKPFRLTPSK